MGVLLVTWEIFGNSMMKTPSETPSRCGWVERIVSWFSIPITPELWTLPIARIVRDGSGHFAFDSHFIPPCVKISASDRLLKILSRLVEILQEKSEVVS